MAPVEAEGMESTPLVTGRNITPAGRQTEVGSFPSAMALSPDGRFLVVTNTGERQYLTVLSTPDGGKVSQLGFNRELTGGTGGRKEGLYYGLAFGPKTADGTLLYASRGSEDRVGVLTLADDGKLKETGRFLDNPSGTAGVPLGVAGVALSADGSRLFAANNNTGRHTGLKGLVSVFETGTGRRTQQIEAPGYPFAVAALTQGPDADRKVYVSSERDACVAVLKVGSRDAAATLPTGEQPIGLLLNRKQDRLYVANAGSDTVSIIDTRSDKIVRTVLLRPGGAHALPGATPTGLALSRDEKRLFVTLADMSAVAVVDLPEGKLIGYIPVGWYPTAVAVSPDGKRLFVANAKGVNRRNPNPTADPTKANRQQYILNVIEGTVSTIPVPSRKELERHTEQVLENNQLKPTLQEALRVPFKNPGIEHVFYILKENRTYDQVLGDLPQGNGDPKLCLFPRPVTPNQHALAERFALLDNHYCCAEVSADGWNWSTSGMASEYVVRNSHYGYTGRTRTYDYEGTNNGVPVDLLGIPDVARAPSGYLWDHLQKHNVSFRNYGFFIDAILTDNGLDQASPLVGGNNPTKKALVGRSDSNFLQYDTTYADSDAWVLHNAPSPGQRKTFGKFGAKSRFEAWKREFDEYVKNGNLTRFQFLRVPRDHTSGTAPGQHSPRSMVADNDFAVGQIVEAISKSPYWKKSAIFILEDDAQNGFDHVDAHRSIGFVISPFVAKGTHYRRFSNTDSFLRTMQALVAVPPMDQLVATAPILDIFSATPENAEPYNAILPERAIIAEVNGRTAYRAHDSLRLNFKQADAVPDHEMNDILWHALKGKNTPKPTIRYGLKIKAAADEDDD